ncbi:MAG: hypothetical protein WC464_04330 [Bdellovibrionales bacterium]
MKNLFGASSIVYFMSFFLLVGCESISSIHIPNFLGEDEVPDDVKNQSRFVEVEDDREDNKEWPRLGDVPFKPKDFTPKAEYNQSMTELDNQREEAEALKRLVIENDPDTQYSVPLDGETPRVLMPPQFIAK